MSDNPEQKPPREFTPETDEQLDKQAIITLTDIADAIADLKRKLPNLAEAILNGTAADRAR